MRPSNAYLKRVSLISALLVSAVVTTASAQYESPLPDEERPLVELALCLDTSGTMDALLDTVRSQLSVIVGDLALMDPPPRLRVALLSFGSSQNPRETGWVRIETPLTEDLDLISDRLFGLRSGGDTEYVTRVVKTAIEGLEWSDSDEALRLIFVAGNEDADQDPEIDYEDVIRSARDRDIAVHAIYCGQARSHVTRTWNALATAVGTQLAVISPRGRTEETSSPFDEELAGLGASLSKTLIPIGDAGAAAAELQRTQDDNALSLGVSAAAARAQIKVGPYNSQDWDLVESVESGRLDLNDVDEGDLPPTLRSMTAVERRDHVEEMAEQREEIRYRIFELIRKRREHIAARAAQDVLVQPASLDAVIGGVIRSAGESRDLFSGD